MKSHLLALLLVVTPAAGFAADNPDWAYPATPQGGALDDKTPLRATGSEKTYTQKQIGDAFNPPDWYPSEHAAMPDVVAHGRPPAVRGCALCHLPSGDGHPESAGLAGLPEKYFTEQMSQFKSGGRKGIRAATMVTISQAMTDDEIKSAAAYFAAQKPGQQWTKVVETADVPKSYVGEGGMRFVSPGTEREPIGERIIEVPVDEVQAKYRSTHFGFVVYAPPGSIGKGETIARNGSAGPATACAACHGEGLRGTTEAPPIAGRSAMYVFRQLNDIRVGNRSGAPVAPMKDVVANLSDADMVALSAFVASLAP